MKAEDLSIAELLTFQPDKGKIYFKDRRTIFIGADALGTLRKDLISTLGIERAKGFLLRYGWNCGTNDAKYVREMFEWESEDEFIHAGPVIHSITGHVLAVPIELKADYKTGNLYYEGYWYDSYEAEQHINHFGYHHEPVCSTLIGYAGAFSSQFLGRKVIYKEIECMGKGDPYCRCIGKPIEDWGEEIQHELSYYEEENLGIELDKAYRRIEKQKDTFKRVLKINEKLSKTLLQGGGLLTIIQVLGKSLHTAVMIEDVNFTLLESYGECKPHDFSRLLHQQIHNENEKQAVKRLLQDKRTVHITVPEYVGWKHERLISPIILKNEVFGYISLIKEVGEFNELEVISLERTSTSCAIQLLNDRTVIEAEQRIKGEFLEELLKENNKVEDIVYRMKLMGYDLSLSHYLFVFNLGHTNGIKLDNRERYLMELRKKITDTINLQLKNYEKNCLISSKLDKIIALVPAVILDKTKLGPRGFGELLVNLICSKYENIDLTLGISSLCNDIASYKKGYEEAEKAIQIANFKKIKSRVNCFDELGSFGVIFHSKNLDEMKEFAEGLLREVKTYDDEYNSELLKTLYYYLENQGNIHQTSREMKLSIGAIRYRLKRIQEIANFDLTKAKDFFDAHLALQIFAIIGLFEVE